ncbi:acyl-coa dehydrogenase [Holotrichia oblita]|nr:acyl-coa dehydrogenase [Holotrichia oblita]
MVREFAEKEVQPLAAEIDLSHEFPHQTVEKMQKLGMMAVPVPREYGGAGGDYISYAITVEELARVCASTAVICSAHTSLCQCGKALGAFGLTEPNAGTDASAQQTKAVDMGDHWLLNGTKVFITNGGVADTYVVMAMTDKSKGNHGISAFIVESGFEGFSIGKKEEKMGICASSTTELIFQNCKVPKENLLGNIGDGFKVAMPTLDGGRIGIASQALGIAQGALDVTVEYMKARKQFGKKLSKFQALQFEIADMKTRVEAARLLIYQAADKKQRGLKYGTESAMAKLFAAETAMEGVPSILNHDDANALEEALKIKDMNPDTKITVVTMGPPQAKDMLLECMAMGADEGVLASDRLLGGSDTWATSNALAAAIDKIGKYDIIFAGRQAIDGDTAQEFSIDKDNKTVTVKRALEDGYEVIKIKTPCMLTAIKELNEPRYMSVHGIIDACKKEIPTWGAKDLGVDPDREVGLEASPTNVFRSFTPAPKGKGKMLEADSEKELAQKLLVNLKGKHVI